MQSLYLELIRNGVTFDVENDVVSKQILFYLTKLW